jgi:hypothetical protein
LKSGKLSVFTREISNFLFKFLNKLQIWNDTWWKKIEIEDLN